jgi:methylthioribulose-1-phosphate dehydratase
MARAAENPVEIVCELCREFHGRGWVSAARGGVSIRGPEGIYMAPDGVMRDRVSAEQVFLFDAGDLSVARALRAPKGLQCEQSWPQHFVVHAERDAGAVIHSHSVWAVLAARMFSPDGKPDVFFSEELEAQRGLRGKAADDEVEIPIVANAARASELAKSMGEAMKAHEDVDAVLVVGHGVYAWGATWIQARIQAEALDDLFRTVVEARRLGLPIAAVPT